MPRLTKTEKKALWAILWRVLLFGPIVWALGVVLLGVVMAAYLVPPFYAILAFYMGEWYFGLPALAAWAVLLRFRKPILRWTLQGIEYGSL